MPKKLVENVTQTVLDYIWDNCIKPATLTILDVVDWGFRFGTIWCLFKVAIDDKDAAKKTKLVFATWVGIEVIKEVIKHV